MNYIYFTAGAILGAALGAAAMALAAVSGRTSTEGCTAAEWENNSGQYTCTNCGWYIGSDTELLTPYCPGCGARMWGGDDKC